MKKLCGMVVAVFLLLFTVSFAAGCGEENMPAANFYYSAYGAVGDGETDDFEAIIQTHAAANAYAGKATVKADEGAVYYIGSGLQKTAIIQTNVDWTDASFIIDDTEMESYSTLPEGDTQNLDAVNNGRAWKDSWIFRVEPTIEPYELDVSSVVPFEKGQDRLYQQSGGALTLSQDAVVVAVNKNIQRYVRKGNNANEGADQQDVFILRKNGSVDESTPVIWDFDEITKMTVYPIDETTLTIKGGHFTTWANQGSTDNSFMKRGIHITRSNTVIDGITRNIEKEKIPADDSLEERLNNTGAPYTGFLFYENCADVTLQNSTLCGHRAYRRASNVNTIRGNYDIQANRTINLTILDTDQLRDIKNSTWWGVFASNYSKNMLLDNVKFSRFDAHMGVNNTTILNSELGHQGCSIIGSGKLLIEGTTIYGSQNFIYFRDDYGSTWEGELYIKDCVFAPTDIANARVISTGNDGIHNFGYETFMPETVTVENLHVQDTGASQGVIMFRITSQSASAAYPLVWTKNFRISGFSSDSGKDYRVSNTANFTNQLNIIPF